MRFDRILIVAGAVLLIAVGLVVVARADHSSGRSAGSSAGFSSLVTTPSQTTVVPVGDINSTVNYGDLSSNPLPAIIGGLDYSSTLATAPQSVVATVGPSYTEITVTWKPPTSTGTSSITKYIVQAFVVGTTVVPVGYAYTPCGPCTKVTLGPVPPGGHFRFVIYAVNASGPGVPGGSNVVIAPGLPSAPLDVTALDGSAKGTAVLSWSAPTANGGAPVDRYLVQTYDVTGPKPIYSGGEYTSCGACTNATVTGLQLDHKYEFAVWAHNGAGFGRTPAASGTIVAT